VFSVKVPQTITHDKVLLDCDAEIAEFLKTMDILGLKLGPVIFSVSTSLHSKNTVFHRADKPSRKNST
jgi:uncharacterized protein YecE (DUF72 family)